MTKEKIIKKIIDTVMQDIYNRLEDLVTIAFDDWEKKELEKLIEED